MSLRVVHAPELNRCELLAGDGGQLVGFADVRPRARFRRPGGS